MVTAAALVVLALASLHAALPVQARAEAPQEYQIKAAFLYNFAKFVEWPAVAFRDAQSPLLVCVLGKDPFGEALDSLRDKTVEGRKIQVRRIARIEDAEGCHILFVSSSEREDLSRILKAVWGKSILTVGDMKGFTQAGGIINLTMTEGKISFEINTAAAERASLKISSKLLKLGRVVRE
jgi:hypothetical protein